LGSANTKLNVWLLPLPELGVTESPGKMVVLSAALAGDAPPPDTVAWLINGEEALDATFTVTVIAG
jgi:hypothetical protein